MGPNRSLNLGYAHIINSKKSRSAKIKTTAKLVLVKELSILGGVGPLVSMETCSRWYFIHYVEQIGEISSFPVAPPPL